MINPETGNRIVDGHFDGFMETGKELERRNLVKGFEFKKDSALPLSDDDFDSVKVESLR